MLKLTERNEPCTQSTCRRMIKNFVTTFPAIIPT